MRCFVFFLLATVYMAAGRQTRGMHGAFRNSPAPAPAPASDTPSMPVTHVETEIENLNYYDLTKEWKDPFDVDETGHDVDAGGHRIHDTGDATQSTTTTNDDSPTSTAGSPGTDPLGEMLGDATGDGPKTDSPIDDSPAHLQGSKRSLLQVDALSAGTTVQKKLRDAIEHAVEEIVAAAYGAGPAPAPAVAPAPSAGNPKPVPTGPPMGLLPKKVSLVSRLFAPPWGKGPPPTAQMTSQAPASARSLRAAPAPGFAASPSVAPAPGPAADTVARPKVHVALFPGKKMKKRHLLNSPPIHATTLLKVTLFERPGNGLNDMQGIKQKLQLAVASGELHKSLAAAIHAVTGVKPVLAAIKVTTKMIQQWDIQKCGAHMSMLVKSFTVHYTKRQVPMALYNECTNFMTKFSFSHDYVLDSRDAARCRKATATFAKRWKLGDNKAPTKFEPMCQNFCEAKFGDDAPQCQLAAQ